MKKHQDDSDNILEVIEATISSSHFYWQSLSLVLCFIFSYIFYRIVKKSFLSLGAKTKPSPLKRNPEINRVIAKYLVPLLYLLISVIFLSIGLSIYSQFFKGTILFSTMIKLTSLLLFLRFLRISSNSSFVTNAVGAFLVPALILDVFNLLDSTIAYLDYYGFKIGKIRLSIYVAIKAFIVILIVLWFSGLVSKKSKLMINKNREIKPNTKNIINKLIDILVYSAVVFILFKTFGIDMTAFAVIGGAVGVGVGFGLQKIASNFISGIILLFEQSVEIGDVVELENGIFGVVKHFGGRHTLIEAYDGKEIMIPNEEFIINKVTNWTYSNNHARIEINIGVAYGSDLEKVKEVLISAAKEHPKCLSHPEVSCFLVDFGDFDIKFTLFLWISDIVDGRFGTKSEVLMSIWKKFRENNIEIPFPQREVRLLK